MTPSLRNVFEDYYTRVLLHLKQWNKVSEVHITYSISKRNELHYDVSCCQRIVVAPDCAFVLEL